MALQAIFDDSATADIVLETGYRKPLGTVTVSDKEEIIRVLKRYHTLIKVKAEIDQFIEGLQCLGIDHLIKEHPDLMEPLFVNKNKSLTAGMCV